MLCRADTTGGLVLEIEMKRAPRGSGNAGFQIRRAVVGITDRAEVDLGPTNSSCSSWFGDNDRVGNRYLLFTRPRSLTNGEQGLSACGYYGNLILLDDDAEKIYFPGNDNGKATAPRWEDLNGILDDFTCGGKGGEDIINPLKHATIAANPGRGAIRIDNLFGDAVGSTDVFVYNASGDLILRETYTTGESPLNLGSSPQGIYFVRLRKGRHQKTLRYLKQ
ncbi:hypothetical protein A3850_015480 [Lewinella sp. 4G2]|nr:hypothetical protein A3850_015480 [Lewinella sp. 4G2]